MVFNWFKHFKENWPDFKEEERERIDLDFINIPAGISPDFVKFCKDVSDNKIVMTTIADVKKNCLWAVNEGEDKPTRTREWLCRMMQIINYSGMSNIKGLKENENAYGCLREFHYTMEACGQCLGASKGYELKKAWEYIRSRLTEYDNLSFERS